MGNGASMGEGVIMGTGMGQGPRRVGACVQGECSRLSATNDEYFGRPHGGGEGG